MKIRTRLLRWYRAHKREMPWRNTRDPYLIWVSEVIMQQTRIEQGTGYYHRFVACFPDVAALAAASEQEVLKVWQGLGYYTRARNLHAAARTIVEEHGGRFPETYAEIRKLKGIGDYSAASIASLSSGEARPAVDANVFRFLARFSGMALPAQSSKGKKRITDLAASLLDPRQPGQSNQALIEFGALVCKPVRPACRDCMFQTDCIAYRQGKVSDIPVKTPQMKPRPRYFHYLVIRRATPEGIRIHLVKREQEDIWKNLYDLPLIETPGPMTIRQMVGSNEWKSMLSGTSARFEKAGKLREYKLSHRIIRARFYEVEIRKPLNGNYLEISSSDIINYPVSRLLESYLQGH
jgi:A/G-specific adenine glycosylase